MIKMIEANERSKKVRKVYKVVLNVPQFCGSECLLKALRGENSYPDEEIDYIQLIPEQQNNLTRRRVMVLQNVAFRSFISIMIGAIVIALIMMDAQSVATLIVVAIMIAAMVYVPLTKWLLYTSFLPTHVVVDMDSRSALALNPGDTICVDSGDLAEQTFWVYTEEGKFLQLKTRLDYLESRSDYLDESTHD